MAQCNSANANASPAEPDGETPAIAARRRAAAYLDLWERQIRHAASQGPDLTPTEPSQG